VSVGVEYAAVVEDEGAGHLESVAGEGADAVFVEDAGGEAAKPDARAEELRERAAFELEGVVESLCGIGDAWEVLEAVACEEALGFAVGGGLLIGRGVVWRAGHVDEAGCDAAFGEGVAVSGDVAGGFAAEGAAEVSEEEEEDG